MTIYFQHVGQRGGLEHFPRTIGTAQAGLRRFFLSEIEKYLFKNPEQESAVLAAYLQQNAPIGFQIWGAPSGARSILAGAAPGDWLLLLETDRPGGQFYYAGRILYRAPKELFDLSTELWGEARYPIILLLDGKLTNFPWDTFRDNFAYGANWKLQSRTYRITPERLAQSTYLSEEDVIVAMIGVGGSSVTDETFATLLDPVELLYDSMEGRKALREHILRERDSGLVRKFKGRLKSFECSICKFDFEEIYGKVGKTFIEAHHMEPIGLREGDQPTAISDMIPVCGNCHRMLHRRSPPYLPNDLTAMMANAFASKQK
jgi:5-methylcytosine-specific restriction protein A